MNQCLAGVVIEYLSRCHHAAGHIILRLVRVVRVNRCSHYPGQLRPTVAITKRQRKLLIIGIEVKE